MAVNKNSFRPGQTLDWIAQPTGTSSQLGSLYRSHKMVVFQLYGVPPELVSHKLTNGIVRFFVSQRNYERLSNASTSTHKGGVE